MNRAVLWSLLAVVAGAAAVLSFSSLTALAVLCGFSARLAWLLPVTIDAGAGAGCLAWLGGAPGINWCTTFARSLTFILLSASVAGNAVVHYLAAYRLAPPWWLVAAVSAVAPAVLGAVVHLAVVSTQRRSDGVEMDAAALGEPDRYVDTPETVVELAEADPVTSLIESGAGRRKLARELSISEHAARQLLRTNGVTR